MPRRLLALAVLTLACGGPRIQERVAADLAPHLPATLEADRPRAGEPRTATIRVWVDAAVRALPRWKDEVSEQVDYASQLLTPLLGVRLQVAGWKDWDRTGAPSAALQQLTELDKGDGVTWVVGYTAAGDTASKAMTELGDARPLGHHVVVRWWAETPETAALASALPDLKEAERGELYAAHRRHKQTVVLLHHVAATLGAIGEADPTWIAHPTYGIKQAGFADRTRELLTLAVDARLAEATDETIAKALLGAIEKAEWGGWIEARKAEVTTALRSVIDAQRAGKTAADIPQAAYDQVTRIQNLARRGDAANALGELDNLLTAYPGNAALHLIKCELLAGGLGTAPPPTRAAQAGPPAKVVPNPAAKAACARVSELAPGDPSPHLVLGAALLRAADAVGARAELVQAEATIANLPAPADAWRQLIGLYQGIDALTWAEGALAKAGLDADPAAAAIRSVRARYGVPRGATFVTPADEGALVRAVKAALAQVYASKYGPAEAALAAAEKRWARAPGLAAVRCDLALRMGQIEPARAACRRALAGQPDNSWALYLSGVIALREASGTTAGVAHLRAAIAADPELGQAWRTLGKALVRAKDQAALDQLAQDYQAKFGQALPR